MPGVVQIVVQHHGGGGLAGAQVAKHHPIWRTVRVVGPLPQVGDGVERLRAVRALGGQLLRAGRALGEVVAGGVTVDEDLLGRQPAG